MVPEYYVISALPNWLFNVRHAFSALWLCTNGVRLSVCLLSRMINISKIRHSSFHLHFLRNLIPFVRNPVTLNLSLVHFHVRLNFTCTFRTFGGARSKGFVTLRNVSKLTFFDKIGHPKCVSFRFYSAI